MIATTSASEKSALLPQILAPEEVRKSVLEPQTNRLRGYRDKTGTQLMGFIKLTAQGIALKRSYNIDSIQVLNGLSPVSMAVSPATR